MPPAALLLFLLVSLPLIEIYVLIEVGSALGAVATIGLLMVMAIAGTLLLRLQGLQTMARVREALARGELPASTLIEGFILAVAGVLLVVPGFATDILAFICLMPPARRALANLLARDMLTRKAGQTPPAHTLEGVYRIEEER